MITRAIHHRNPRRIAGKPWQPPYVADSFTHTEDEGVITESIDGREVRITVRLKRTWTVMLRLAGGDQCESAEFKRLFQHVRRIANWFDCALKVAVVCAALYFAWEIGSAFLPGGAVERVLGGLR